MISRGESYMQDVYRALAALALPTAVKVLRPTGLPEGGDIVDWLQGWVSNWDSYAPIAENLHKVLRGKLWVEMKNAEAVPEDWNKADSSLPNEWPENPIEINIKLKPVMPFDPTVLPNAFKSWVSDISHRMQCPPDHVAATAMVALSAVVGKKGLFNPKAKDDWIVCPNLWGLNIGRSSAMKSPAASEALKSLQRLEIAAKEAFENASVDDDLQSFIDKEGRAVLLGQAEFCLAHD